MASLDPNLLAAVSPSLVPPRSWFLVEMKITFRGSVSVWSGIGECDCAPRYLNCSCFPEMSKFDCRSAREHAHSFVGFFDGVSSLYFCPLHPSKRLYDHRSSVWRSVFFHYIQKMHPWSFLTFSCATHNLLAVLLFEYVGPLLGRH